MKRYFKYIKNYWYFFVFGPIFMILEACGEFILPFMSANIINIGASSKDIHYIFENSVYMALIAVFMLVCGVLGAYFAVSGASLFAADIRLETFKKIQTFSFSNIDDFSTGSLITRITNDISQIQNFTQTFLRGLFRSPVMIIGALIMSFMLDKNIAFILMIAIPVLGFIIIVIMKISAPRYNLMQQKLDNLNININEMITNQKVIKSFVRGSYEIDKFENINNELVEKSTKALKMMMLMQPISTLIINMVTIFVVWFAGEKIMIGEMEIGTLTALITYLTQILTALNFLANIILLAARASVSNKRILEVLETESDICDNHSQYNHINIEKGSIEFKNVSFKYYKNNQEKILNNISFKIDSNEFVGIIGSSGAGKTTLISMINRLYDVDEGNVYVDDIDVRELSLYKLREKIAIVLQKNTLFSGTISENLRWGNENATDEELIKACQIAQADSFIQSFKEGYETELEQGGSNLSGGQRQRICIARALLKKPKILILDDSTSAVDTATDSAIRKSFKNELNNMTKIIIAQRIHSIIEADKIIVLENGKIAGIGTHLELLNNCKEYQEIYYSQMDKEDTINGK